MERACFLFPIFMAILMVHFYKASLVIASVLNVTTDQSALLALKTQISYDPRNILTNWSAGTSVCSWIGITCGLRHHRVTALNLSYMGLIGTIPPHMGNLSFLVSLSVKNNSFHGSMPNELARLYRLRHLYVEFNDFKGEIPSWMGLLSKLQYLSLSGNSFTGSIPSSIFNISTLQGIYLRENKLSGSVPSIIFNMSSLEVIDLHTNELSGELPEDMFNHLPKLQRLDVSYNQFHGKIPSTLFKCKQLQYLSLWDNSFTGGVPSKIGNLTMLTKLYLGYNNFEGTIPSTLFKCKQLQILSLPVNRFTGSVPSEIGDLIKLTKLYLFNNSIGGDGDSMMQTMTLATIGYMAPEYGSEGVVSTRGDVYSYGILLMETFTRKKPTNNIFAGEMSLKRWVEESLPHSVTNVVDAYLLRTERDYASMENCMSSIMGLALQCCAELPEQRIKANNISIILNKIKLKFLHNTEGS